METMVTERVAIALGPVTPGSSPSLDFPLRCGEAKGTRSVGRTVHNYLDTNLQGVSWPASQASDPPRWQEPRGWNWTLARMAGPPGLPFPQHQPPPQTSSLTSCSAPAACLSPELRAARICAR